MKTVAKVVEVDGKVSSPIGQTSSHFAITTSIMGS